MDELSYLSNADSQAIEDLYSLYRKNPASVDIGWRRFFEGFEFSGHPGLAGGEEMKPAEFKVIDLINDYRKRGHLFTKTNPVRTRRTYTPSLDYQNFGLTDQDLDTVFQAGKEIGIGPATLRQIIEHLQQTYCLSVGVEYVYIRKTEIFEWLKTGMEKSRNMPDYDSSKKMDILNQLGKAVLFEKFLHKKFPGQKRFSLEGCESLIPALDAIIEHGSNLGIDEFVIGMAHRGRLNVLANIMGKPYQDIFNEFAGKELEDEFLMGDVKYHLGYSSQRKLGNGKTISLSLAPNPSHLEAVGPVVEGIVRSKIDSDYLGDAGSIVPVIIHGDASIAGQGVVYETLQMSELKGYGTGGTIHLVINNQIGFTTNYLDGRSSIYCTDVAKTTHCPVFHVNADDVEAVIHTVEMAMDYRQTFHRDVFIDLLGYRKYGHNEGDEPRFTQPILYKIIETHPDPMTIYVDKLREGGIISQEEAETIEKDFFEILEKDLTESKEDEKTRVFGFQQKYPGNHHDPKPEEWFSGVKTSITKSKFLRLAESITILPADKPFFKKLVKLMEERSQMVAGEGKLDWAMGELLAYASLVDENIPVRLSGQDTERGTFSHRHAVLTMEDSEEKYCPLEHVSEGQAKFSIYNSLLSEYAVLGFEYGYSLSMPEALTIWEAQFGDFNNGAQVITDQYLVSAEDKWKLVNSLVMFLPHGYEGQGSEHSSARLERFLQLCAENNIQVANCTTPANFFHILRRQGIRGIKKPLVILTPKSLLRHPLCVSKSEEFISGHFQEVIDDPEVNPEKVNRVDFCSGKIYYELVTERKKRGTLDIAFVRIEQLYPFPEQTLKKIIQKYKNAKRFAWVQEEPANMGAWSFLLRNFNLVKLLLVARPESGSPATGSFKLHTAQQLKIVDKAFGDCTCENRNITCKMTCSPREWHLIEDQ